LDIPNRPAQVLPQTRLATAWIHLLKTARIPCGPFEDYFRDWFKRVDETQAVQPHWKPPLITTSPILTELYKYDQYWEHLSNGAGNLTIFDTGKGFELIPAKPIEVIIGLPPYEERSGKNPAVGWGDWLSSIVCLALMKKMETIA
jgi:hypothetical protein